MSSHIDWSREPVPDLSQYESQDEARENFAWSIPDTYNIATDVVTKHAQERGKLALIEHHEDGTVDQYTFWQIERLSNQLANGLTDLGIGRGDRIGVIASQRLETALIHVAAWKAGAITVPLSALYGYDELSYRLTDNEAELLFAADDVYEDLDRTVDGVDSLAHVVGLDGEPALDGVETHRFDDVQGARSFDAVETAPEDPAVILYTSGTTGAPKGVVQSHEYLIGHLPGIQVYYELPWHGVDRSVWYTPADWAWAGGLFDVLLPGWHYGIPVVGSHSSDFDPEEVFELVDTYGISQMFLTTTMMSEMAQVDESAYDTTSVASIFGAGEAIQTNIREWAREVFDAPINGGYGQTEANLVVGYNSQWGDDTVEEIGCVGEPIPGHTVDVIDESGDVKPDDEIGKLATQRPDPVVMKEYWNNPEKTESAFIGDWFDSGDLGYRDGDGYLWFTARAEDIIVKGDQKVGPGTVEDALSAHEAVAQTAVIGVEGPDGTDVVKAYVVLADGWDPSEETSDALFEAISADLEPHETPSAIEFIDELPTTTTGKIQRYKLKQREE